MKLSEAIEKGKNRHWACAQARRNPSSPNQWFVMLENKKHMSVMLVNDNELPILSEDLNYFIDLFGEINVREFTVFL